MTSIAVLGSTGSIGTQALDVIARNPDRFTVVAISAGGNIDLLAQQAVSFQVPLVAVAAGTVEEVRSALRTYAVRAGHPAYVPEVVVGPDASTRAAEVGADVVLNGITGSIGLRPTLAALAVGSTLALANKESLIVGGALVRAAAAPGQIVPVDSEHSALFQLIAGENGLYNLVDLASIDWVQGGVNQAGRSCSDGQRRVRVLPDDLAELVTRNGRQRGQGKGSAQLCYLAEGSF